MRLFLLLLFATPAFGQIPQGGITGAANSGNIALVTHTCSSCPGNSSGGHTGAVNTIGSTLYVASCSQTSSPVGTPSDTQSNTWTKVFASDYARGTAVFMNFFYVAGPTTNSAAKFTAAGETCDYTTWSGTLTTSSVVDTGVQNGANYPSGTTVFAAGSVTPTQNGELLITAITYDNSSSTFTLNNSFTTVDVATFGPFTTNAYLVDASTSALNATWTITAGTSHGLVAVAGFKH